MVVTVNRDSVQRRIVAQLSGIQQTTSLVIAFCCDSRLASRLYAEARRLNMLNGDWVWLALEEATEGDPTAGDWPLGLLGLVSQRPQRFNKHTMKGSLAILHSAIRASLPVQQQFHAWNDNFNNNHSSLRLDVARKLYRYSTLPLHLIAAFAVIAYTRPQSSFGFTKFRICLSLRRLR